jgi:hypothetical protein
VADQLLYLYGFLPSGAEPPPAKLRGVGDRAVEVMSLGPFDAAVSRVPAEEFGAGTVEDRLRDLEWVARQGGAHERVVTWFVDQAWILPARLLTLYSGRASLERSAGEREREILESLERLGGLYEWDIKVSYDRARLEGHLGELAPGIAAMDEKIAGAPPGKGYLLRQARKEKEEEAARGAARRLAEDLLEHVSGMAERTVRVPLPREADAMPVVLNAALLVREERGEEIRERLGRRAEELGEKGVRVAFSGPWAPYRFLEGGDDGGEAAP